MKVSVIGVEYNSVLESYRHTFRYEEPPFVGLNAILYLAQPLEMHSTIELVIGVPEHVAKSLE